MTLIRVGSTVYAIDGQRIPYFGGFIRFHSKDGDIQPLQHSDIDNFVTIYKGTHMGFHHFFKLLPRELDAYRRLIEALDFLSVDILGGGELMDVVRDLQSLGSPYGGASYVMSLSPEKGLHFKLWANRLAFRFLYLLLFHAWEDESAEAYMFVDGLRQIEMMDWVFLEEARVVILEAFREALPRTLTWNPFSVIRRGLGSPSLDAWYRDDLQFDWDLTPALEPPPAHTGLTSSEGEEEAEGDTDTTSSSS